MRGFKKNLTKPEAEGYALFVLGQRAYSVKQLQVKMAEKGYKLEEIDNVIQRLTALGYLNDQQFAQNYLDNLIKYKSFGYFGIKKKLITKKFEGALIEKLLRDFKIKDELKIAEKFVKSHARAKSYGQVGRMLQNRGFRGDVISKILRGFKTPAE